MKYYKLFFFILIPFLLIIPLFHLNISEITEQENRTLFCFPKILKENELNYEFGKEFENWLDDRFWGRNKLIDVRFQTMYKINGRIENDKAFVGDDGWMFMKDGIVNVPSIEKQRKRIEQDADILKRFDDKFKGKNIPIYLVLIPDRNQLYQKYWERYYTPKPRLDYGDELIKALKDHPNIHVIYPKNEFVKIIDETSYDYLFYKKDWHLTPFGRYLIEKAFLERIKKEILPSLKWKNIPKEEEKLETNNISSKLGFPIKEKERHRTIQIKVQNANSYQEKESFQKIFKGKGVYNNLMETIFRKGNSTKGDTRTYISMGVCYSQDLFHLLKNEFDESVWIRTNVGWLGKEAYIHMQERIKEVLNLKDREAVISIIGDIYSELEKSMNSLEENLK